MVLSTGYKTEWVCAPSWAASECCRWHRRNGRRTRFHRASASRELRLIPPLYFWCVSVFAALLDEFAAKCNQWSIRGAGLVVRISDEPNWLDPTTGNLGDWGFDPLGDVQRWPNKMTAGRFWSFEMLHCLLLYMSDFFILRGDISSCVQIRLFPTFRNFPLNFLKLWNAIVWIIQKKRARHSPCSKNLYSWFARLF
jgi:hypothetical protein